MYMISIRSVICYSKNTATSLPHAGSRRVAAQTSKLIPPNFQASTPSYVGFSSVVTQSEQQCIE